MTIKIIKLNRDTRIKCTICGDKATSAVITQTESECKRNTYTRCFSLCLRHKLQIIKDLELI